MAAQGDRPADIRDRALLLLLAVYGLRAGEVVGLRLEDFDWEQELLTVPHGKRQRPRTYPLVPSRRRCRPPLSAGGAAPVRRGARCSSRCGHRSGRCPGAAWAKWSTGAYTHWGVTLPHYGPHALRHACATHLLAQGLSLKEIGDHLGHQSPETTRIYAKVDLAGLRTVGDFDLEGLL